MAGRKRKQPVVFPPDVWADGALKVADAAAFSGLCRDTLYELMRAGSVAWAKPGKNRVIARRSLAAWLASRAVGRP